MFVDYVLKYILPVSSVATALFLWASYWHYRDLKRQAVDEFGKVHIKLDYGQTKLTTIEEVVQGISEGVSTLAPKVDEIYQSLNQATAISVNIQDVARVLSGLGMPQHVPIDTLGTSIATGLLTQDGPITFVFQHIQPMREIIVQTFAFSVPTDSSPELFKQFLEINTAFRFGALGLRTFEGRDIPVISKSLFYQTSVPEERDFNYILAGHVNCLNRVRKSYDEKGISIDSFDITGFVRLLKNDMDRRATAPN